MEQAQSGGLEFAAAVAKWAIMADALTFSVSEDDDGIRLDRWFKRHQPEISFNMVSRWARTGQLRLDGKRVAPGDRIGSLIDADISRAAQNVRAVPAASADPAERRRP